MQGHAGVYETYMIENAYEIGKYRAGLVWSAYGQKCLDVLIEDPERVAKDIKGISLRIAKDISDELRANRDDQDTELELIQMSSVMGISKRARRQILGKFGTNCIRIIKNNPYMLIEEIDSIGFEKADLLGLQLNGGNKTDPRRVSAGILYSMKRDVQGSGNLYMTLATCQKMSMRILEHQTCFYIDQIIPELRNDGKITVVVDPVRGNLLYLTDYYKYEQSVRHALVNKATETIISSMEPATTGLADDQKLALELIANHGIFIVTGAPGTGKTYLIKRIHDSFTDSKFEMAAPTGKAAKRITEQTGVKAFTIHKLLQPGISEDGHWEFKCNEENPIKADIIIVDECSMIDIWLMHKLLSAISESTRIIFVGDHNQLPPVGPGNVLLDMLESGVIQRVELTEIKRQDEETGDIIRNCHRIKNGEPIVLNENDSTKDFYTIPLDDDIQIMNCIRELITVELPERFPYLNHLMDIQILSPHRTKVSLSCDALNPVLQDMINPNGEQCGQSVFRTGDKVIQTVNDYALDLCNGDLGIIKECNGRELTVNFEYPDRTIQVDMYDNQLFLAYALTVHKFQGSEAPIIIIPMHKTFSSMLMYKELVYTAISRAQTQCIIVGDMDILHRALSTGRNRRNTLLANYLYHDLMGR